MKSFKEHINEAVGVERIRKVRKAIERVNKTKLKPETWGFDIEFYYPENYNLDDSIKEWMKVIEKRGFLYDGFREWWYNHENYPGYISMDDWDYENEKPEPENYDEGSEDYHYKRDLDIYNRERGDMADSIETFIADEQDYLYDYATETMDKAAQYIEMPMDAEGKIGEYTNIIENLGENVGREDQQHDGDVDYSDTWNVHMDGGGVPEIASRILTTRDFGLVRELLNNLKNEKTSDGTSAHIHIGLPIGFDLFSLLSLFVLVDEKNIKERLPKRLFGQFAAMSDATTRKINKLLMNLLQDRTYKVLYRNNQKWGIVTDDSFRNSSIGIRYVDNKLIKGDKDLMQLKKLIQNGDIKITSKRVWRTNSGKTKTEVTINYMWLKFDNHPFVADYKKIRLLDDNGRLNLDSSIVDNMLEQVQEKHSGINFGYYKDRNVIEFRYLSSEILGSVDEFFKYVNYFMYLPMIAMRSKRIRIGDFILQKKEDGNVVAIASPKVNK